MADHAILSPSSAQRVLDCPASFYEEQKYPDVPQRYTAEGTLAHDLADMALRDGVGLTTKIGATFEVDGFTFTVDKTMVGHVQRYVDFVREETAGADAVMFERRVYDGPMLFGASVDAPAFFSPGFPERDQPKDGALDPAAPLKLYPSDPAAVAFGRVDASAVYLKRRLLKVIDLKYGYTPVSAVRNAQEMRYALGVLYELEGLDEDAFDEVEMIIYQPRLNEDEPASRWSCSVADLKAFGKTFGDHVRNRVFTLEGTTDYQPSEKACQFCNARPHCRARRDSVTQVMTGMTAATPDDFGPITDVIPSQETLQALPMDDVWLGTVMDKVGLIEDFCNAVRAEVERRLLSGHSVPGFKLVEGRLGNRSWADEEAVITTMSAMKLKKEQMYKSSLHSPTEMERVLKKANPKQWARLQEHIHRPQGRPSVAPLSDERPALQLSATAEDFV